MDETIQHAIERFWDTIPGVWGRVRCQARNYAVQDFGISLIQFHILRHIRRGARSVAEIAERQFISRPAISQAVDGLVEKGLVSRVQESRDRRYFRLDLTDTGNTLLTNIFTKNRAWMAEQMADLKPQELDTVMQALSILKKTFDETDN